MKVVISGSQKVSLIRWLWIELCLQEMPLFVL